MTSSRLRPRTLLAFTALAVFAAGNVIQAGPGPLNPSPKGKSKKVPSPAKALAQAYKNLSKQKSYSTSLSVEGGISDTPDHELSQVAVRETYNGDIYRSLMSIPGKKTFKTPKKGVRYISGYWRNVVSDREGKMLDSFFRFPQDVLKQAMRHAKRGKWQDLASSDETGADKKDSKKSKKSSKSKKKSDDDDYELEGDSKKKRRGKTSVAKKGKKSKKTEEVDIDMPTTILIEAPTKEALNHYLTVEKSGCLGGG